MVGLRGNGLIVGRLLMSIPSNDILWVLLSTTLLPSLLVGVVLVSTFTDYQCQYPTKENVSNMQCIFVYIYIFFYILYVPLNHVVQYYLSSCIPCEWLRRVWTNKS